ncbi:MAG: hypothetical protein AAGA61_03990, partial [Pseudomonadota bacterium]
ANHPGHDRVVVNRRDQFGHHEQQENREQECEGTREHVPVYRCRSVGVHSLAASPSTWIVVIFAFALLFDAPQANIVATHGVRPSQRSDRRSEALPPLRLHALAFR